MATPAPSFRCSRIASRFVTTVVSAVTLALALCAGMNLTAFAEKPDSSPLPVTVAPQTPLVNAITSPALTPEQVADLHMARKRYQAAIQTYNQVQPKTAAIWNKLGIANQQMFIMEEARRSYEAALKMDPKNPDILNNMGTLYYTLKQYGDAERYYRKALKTNPKSSIIYKNLGTALMAEDRFKKGWDCYQRAMALDPEIFDRASQYRVGGPTPPQKRGAINYYLAISYLRVGKADRAVGYLRMAIDEGYTDRKKVMADKEFASLHGISAFEQLLSEQRTQ